jgi:acyl-CoA synthetase (AMP-forming)/AMP-acid ligase II
VNLVDLLAQRVEAHPHTAAIVDARRTITYAGLDEESRRCASVLHAAGLRAGDTVLLLAPMSVGLYVTLIGILRLGMVAMFVDPSQGRDFVERACDLVRPRGCVGIGRARIYRLFSRGLRRIPLFQSIPSRGWTGEPGTLDVVTRNLDDPAIVTFTSGSTGTPKAAMRSHGFLRAQHRAVSDTLELRPGEIDLATLPMFVLANLASGLTSIIPDADLRRPGAIDAAPVVRQMRRWSATRTVASPALLERLASHCFETGDRLDSLTRICTGGGPVSVRLMDRLSIVAPRARISAVYGSTEAEPIALLDRDEIADGDRRSIRDGRGLPAGRPAPALSVRILNGGRGPLGPFTLEEFDRAAAPPGSPGEIVVSGDHVLGGYLNGRGDEENKFSVDGVRWHRTGDAGSFDSQGRLWLLGRCGAALTDRLGTLYPFSVEAAAETFAAVHRAALLGDAGRRVLVVELDESFPREVPPDVRRALDWAALDEIRIVDRSPVDVRHNAKVDYERLRASVPGPGARAGDSTTALPGVLRQSLFPDGDRGRTLRA